MIRALLTDLDRSLTDESLRPDPRALERLAQLRAAGLRVAVVTGRALPRVPMEVRQACDGLVAENGALLADNAGNVVQLADSAFLARVRVALSPIAHRFAWGACIGSAPRGIAAEIRARLGRARVPHGLIFHADEVLVVPPGVDKATGAARLLASWGLQPRDAVAFGDGENDAVMLRSVAWSGAPANAHPLAAAAARVRTPSAYAEGFLAFTAPLLAPAGNLEGPHRAWPGP